MQPIRLAGTKLDPPRHVCAFLSSEQEADRLLRPFVAEGFACGDKAIHVVAPDRAPTHLAWLQAAGIDCAAARTRGQLELRLNTEVYLRDGQFDPERMLLQVNPFFEPPEQFLRERKLARTSSS